MIRIADLIGITLAQAGLAMIPVRRRVHPHPETLKFRRPRPIKLQSAATKAPSAVGVR
jgi:hypothetical protein